MSYIGVIKEDEVMSEYIQGRMGFNSENKRYGLLISDLWEIDGFHCGQPLDYYDYDKEEWIHTRVEMAWPEQEYYLVDTGLQGTDLEGLKIRVEK